MENHIQARFIALLGMLVLTISMQAQNLIPNPGFEDQIACPYQFHDTVAVPWRHGNDGTTDHFHTCANPNFCGIPLNRFGFQFARSGSAYGGGYSRRVSHDYREYLMTELNTPLIGGQMYYLSFYISLADEGCGIVPYGAYVSQTPPHWVPEEYVMDLSPQYEHAGGYLSDKENWMHMESCILAQGGEKWILFGNFNTYAESPQDPACAPPGYLFDSYYYLDDVSLSVTEPEEEFDAFIGGPFVGCFEVTVDPDIPGTFYWSDGSIGPTFTTNQSGIYSFSVVDSCRLGTGTFEVVVFQQAEELIPDEVQLCEGDTYTITLFGDYGEYIWNNGSTESTLDITEAGYYSVTVDFGCLVSELDVLVEVVQPVPDPIFGEDTHLCSGEVISYSFDEIIGSFLWQDGSTESEYEIETGGTYQLTISNACGVVDDEIIIVDYVEPEVNLGPDTFLCENATLEISLDPAQGEYFWQDGSDETEYTISSPGTYSVFVFNVCGQQSDYLTVTGIPALQTNLGLDLTLCAAQLPVTLDATSVGSSMYFWNDSTIASQLLATNAGTYSVTVSNVCFTKIDTVNIIVSNDPPEVILPADMVLCPKDTVVITNEGATGDYQWHDQSIADSLLVTSPGIYSLSVTNICGTGSDSITVDYIPDLQLPDLGPDFSLCTGDQFTLTSGNTSVVYQWQDMSAADSFIVTAPGVYHVTVSNQCETARDTVVVTLNNNPPDVDLPVELNLCQGEVITLQAGISGVAYVWNDGSQSSTLNVTSPGMYSLTVSSNCGSDIDSVIVHDAGPQPLVDLGNDINLCEGESIVITPAFSNVDSWLWHDGSNSPSIEINVGGEISVQATNFCGTVYDTLQINQLPAIPPLSLGNDTSFCPGDPVVLSINIPDIDITWSDGTNGNSIIVNTPGSYHAMITNACGQSVDTIAIEMLPDAPVVDLGVDQKICPNELIVFVPGISDAAYLWQDGSTSTTFTAASPGTIILHVSNSCGVDADTVLIIENTEGPQVNLGPDITGCAGDEVTVEADVLGVDYLWHDGSDASYYTTSLSSTLILTVSNNCGVDTDTIEVDLSGVAPDVELGVDTTICAGTSLILQSSSQMGTTWMWQDGSAASSYEVTLAGIYSLTAINACGEDSDFVQVDIAYAPESFSLGSDTILCLGEYIELTAPVTDDDILWNDGSASSNIVVDEEGVYGLHISNQCGSVSDEITISINDNIPVVELDDEFIICQGEKIVLDAGQSFPSDYLWSTGENSSSITVVTTGSYAVTVFNECFTVYHELIAVDEGCTPHIFIPNVFSPNGDGINDYFVISLSENITVLEIQGNIYDRWGDLVFTSTGFPFNWDGIFKDQPLNPGVFRYLIQVKYILRGVEKEEVLVGDVTIIR